MVERGKHVRTLRDLKVDAKIPNATQMGGLRCFPGSWTDAHLREFNIQNCIGVEDPGDYQKGAGKSKYKYKGRLYAIRTGKRGGKYIVCQGKKIYVM